LFLSESVPMVITTKLTVRQAAQRSQGDVAIPTLHADLRPQFSS
jgi:hypothetical protein